MWALGWWVGGSVLRLLPLKVCARGGVWLVAGAISDGIAFAFRLEEIVLVRCSELEEIVLDRVSSLLIISFVWRAVGSCSGGGRVSGGLQGAATLGEVCRGVRCLQPSAA